MCSCNVDCWMCCHSDPCAPASRMNDSTDEALGSSITATHTSINMSVFSLSSLIMRLLVMSAYYYWCLRRCWCYIVIILYPQVAENPGFKCKVENQSVQWLHVRVVGGSQKALAMKNSLIRMLLSWKHCRGMLHRVINASQILTLRWQYMQLS